MRALFLLGLISGCAAAPPATTGSGPPRDYRIVYDQQFETADCLQDFDFSDAASWSWSPQESALELAGVGSYAPPHRSPTSLAILKKLKLEDFVLEAELQQTGENYGHRDMCLFFGYENPVRYYYVHLAPAPDDRAHNVFLVDDAPRTNLADVFEEGMQWQDGVWHAVRLERKGADIRVFVDGAEEPTVEARDTTISRGRIGFGSFDDSGRIRNVRIWAPR